MTIRQVFQGAGPALPPKGTSHPIADHPFMFQGELDHEVEALRCDEQVKGFTFRNLQSFFLRDQHCDYEIKNDADAVKWFVSCKLGDTGGTHVVVLTVGPEARYLEDGRTFYRLASYIEMNVLEALPVSQCVYRGVVVVRR